MLLQRSAPVFTWPRDCGAETDVVGESHYTDALTSIVGKVRDKTRNVDVSAALIPYDFKLGEKAVGVVIKGQLVGHLARDEVDLYLETLERQRQAGKVTQCKATASGQRIDGRPVYWVKLALDVMAGDDA